MEFLLFRVHSAVLRLNDLFKNSQFWGDQSRVEMILPVTPSIGDGIEIPFIEQTGKYYRGYVHIVTRQSFSIDEAGKPAR